jgi:hypothetical protein
LTKGIPLAALSGAQVEAFGAALRARLLDGSGSFPKRYLRQVVSDIRFDGKRLTLGASKAALLQAAAEKEMGAARVLTSGMSWLAQVERELLPVDPARALELVEDFITSDAKWFERAEDSDGAIGGAVGAAWSGVTRLSSTTS